ncbi:12125_t:CDS:2 [Ambispora leptoticha]|uniref:12125_t:CDS:1 n=1 Tax=Ambispora leptoticha TaxID=144679 RepID=A0A9N9HK29_9GLOM|nr:12125_t:CDS:2 [Ambispora leptoticha]
MPKVQNTNFSSFMPYYIRNESFNSIGLDKIDVPYPLDENLVSVLKNNLNNPSKKTPNSFILYRKAFKVISIYHGFRLSANEISRQASKNWKVLADQVKQEYKKIAEELRENTEKHAIKKPSLDNTSELNAVNLLQEPPMTPINAQENSIFSYADLSYTDQFEELFTYTYNLPETTIHVLNQNLMYPEFPMINFYKHFTDSTEVDFKEFQLLFTKQSTL